MMDGHNTTENGEIKKERLIVKLNATVKKVEP